MKLRGKSATKLPPTVGKSSAPNHVPRSSGHSWPDWKLGNTTRLWSWMTFQPLQPRSALSIEDDSNFTSHLVPSYRCDNVYRVETRPRPRHRNGRPQQLPYDWSPHERQRSSGGKEAHGRVPRRVSSFLPLFYVCGIRWVQQAHRREHPI
jgi:hypothetical protein